MSDQSAEVKNSILIVDDEKANLMVLNGLLSENYDVFMAKNGQSALEMVNECLPDLILLDIIMPDIDGYEVLAQIRKLENKIRNVPVIFITGLSGDANEEKGLVLGAADYINKPFNQAIVKLRVQSQLQIVNQMRLIERLSEIDQLTGIPNRRSLDNLMFVEWGKAIRSGLPLGFMMIDVDRFKLFNDTHGHQTGDLVLQSVAKTFKDTLKRSGDFAARYGGEEFSVLLPNTDMASAAVTAEKIRDAVEKTVITLADGSTVKVTISIGVNAQIPTQNETIQDFIAKADAVLYKAKEAGRNKVCCVT
jgi:diguanylate cyclase (GGDEF)-like protein